MFRYDRKRQAYTVEEADRVNCERSATVSYAGAAAEALIFSRYLPGSVGSDFVKAKTSLTAHYGDAHATEAERRVKLATVKLMDYWLPEVQIVADVLLDRGQVTCAEVKKVIRAGKDRFRRKPCEPICSQIADALS
jgi:hypothetical protein